METKHLARMENQSQGRGKETSETSESKMNPHHPQHAFDFLCVPLFRKLKKKCCKNYLKCHNRLKCWEMRTGLEYINRSLKAIWLSDRLRFIKLSGSIILKLQKRFYWFLEFINFSTFVFTYTVARHSVCFHHSLSKKGRMNEFCK